MWLISYKHHFRCFCPPWFRCADMMPLFSWVISFKQQHHHLIRLHQLHVSVRRCHCLYLSYLCVICWSQFTPSNESTLFFTLMTFTPLLSDWILHKPSRATCMFGSHASQRLNTLKTHVKVELRTKDKIFWNHSPFFLCHKSLALDQSSLWRMWR